jgi:predicted transport protein
VPIYRDSNGVLETVRQEDFRTEKELQNLIEANLEEVFGCRFVATEFSTGSVHSGRIDSLALSEDGNPVIIEYKKVEDSKLINQALFYLDWIKDHKGDFELAVQKTLGKVVVNWEYIRVICLAPSYDRYSLHAVKHMGVGLELWQYHKYENGLLEMEEIFRSSEQPKSRDGNRTAKVAQNPTDATSVSFEEHVGKALPEIQPLVREISEVICGMNDSIAEVPLKLYVAYKLAKNIASMEVHKREALLFLPLKFDAGMPSIARDVSKVGHWGTGDLELRIGSSEDLELALPLIRSAYLSNGGD